MTVREQLMTVEGIDFMIKGGKEVVYNMICLENGINMAVCQSYHQMNVRKFGPTCMTLYTFDMLGNRTVGKIKYDMVIIMES